ncbi:MAG: polyprenyl synthetase family protein [Vulcanimicrobiota bacterium]
MNLNDYLKQKRELIDKEILLCLKKEAQHPLSGLYDYCMAAGKRFRPILLVTSAEMFGKTPAQVMPAAISIELIHNFSLIHDDLPCMDNDDFRRGHPTCHKKFGQTDALLGGDGLLIFAFNMLARNAEISEISSESIVKVVELFSRAAGHHGMTGGQVLDMVYQRKEKIELEALEKIHNSKTAALIIASVTAGGILGGASYEEIEKLKLYGKNIGLTYQIIDDLLDMNEDKESISFPSVVGEEKARQMAAESTIEAIEALSIFGSGAQRLKEIATFLLNREK